ncbi:hypothetical protein LCGC14_2214280 [marine sediment metagenome]|uniref:Uncharacterized protein n=1 Tax=marine sediment metagenome TaxID=412755 RepID=A0A0F9DCT1_9ZZZZ
MGTQRHQEGSRQCRKNLTCDRCGHKWCVGCDAFYSGPEGRFCGHCCVFRPKGVGA